MPLEYSLTPVEATPVWNSEPPTGKVIFTIFAGRKRYLECLTRYLDILMEHGLITEVHLWDYVRNPVDRVYLTELTQRKGYVYMKHRPGMRNWDAYYAYYAGATYDDNDILIKCDDDDIVYLDVNTFAGYLNEVRDNGLYFPSIVNNDVGAYIQMKYGVHDHISDADVVPNYGKSDEPLGGWPNGWYKRYDRAAAVHAEFLNDPTKFKINARPFSWNGRISINMFGARFSAIKQYYQLFSKYSESSDEAFFFCKSI